MRFYTWKDIERYILMHHDEWKDELYDIEVYPNEMVVYPKSEQGTLQNAVLFKYKIGWSGRRFDDFI